MNSDTHSKFKEHIRSIAPDFEHMNVESVQVFARHLQQSFDGLRAWKITVVSEPQPVKLDGFTTISDETIERNIDKSGFVDTLLQIAAERSAFDLMDLFINGKKAGPQGLLGMEDGIIAQVPKERRYDARWWGDPAAALAAIKALVKTSDGPIFYGSHAMDLWRDEHNHKDLFGLKAIALDAMPNSDPENKSVMGGPILIGPSPLMQVKLCNQMELHVEPRSGSERLNFTMSVGMEPEALEQTALAEHVRFN